MNRPRLALVGLLAGLITAGSFTTTARAADAAPASRIGVVDLRMVYSKLQETVDSLHSLQGMQEQLDSKQKLDQLQLKDLQEKMGNVSKPGTPAHEDAMANFDKTSLEYQQTEQQMKVNMVRAQAKQLYSAYNAIQATVKDLAAKKGLDVVIISTGQEVPPNAMDIANPETLGNLIFGRNVMYVSDKVDLSAEVIAKLDADYKAGGSKPAPAPAAGH